MATSLNLIPKNIPIVLSNELYLRMFLPKKEVKYTLQTVISGYFNVLKFTLK